VIQCTTSGIGLNAKSNCTGNSTTNSISVTELIASGSTAGAGTNVLVVIESLKLPIDPGQFSITVSTKTQENYIIDEGKAILAVIERALTGSEI
jgi:hypothetical protein